MLFTLDETQFYDDVWGMVTFWEDSHRPTFEKNNNHGHWDGKCDEHLSKYEPLEEFVMEHMGDEFDCKLVYNVDDYPIIKDYIEKIMKIASL